MNEPFDRRDFLSLISAATVAFVPGAAWAAAPQAARAVPTDFFGLHMQWPLRAPYISNFPAVPFTCWRAILPELHWFSLEPKPGEWQFAKMDIAMRLMAARNIDVLYTLGYPAAWASTLPDLKGPYAYGEKGLPRRMADWENYVRTVATRYRGRLRHYELINEPALKEVDGSKAHFSAAELVELARVTHRVLKEVDPQNRLTTPAMVGGQTGVDRMEAFFSAGGHKYCDIVSFHFYGFPEQIPEVHSALKKVMGKFGVQHLPVWNTEYGYLIEDPTTQNTHPLIGGSFARIFPPQEAAALLARSYIIAASVGIDRFYWFHWDGKDMGLVTHKDRQINAAGVAYGTVAGWLGGKEIGPLQRNGNVIFCELFAGGASHGHLVWTRDHKPMTWTAPNSWGSGAVMSLDGSRGVLSPVRELGVSAEPVLIMR